jgi:hypothetical protein
MLSFSRNEVMIGLFLQAAGLKVVMLAGGRAN